MSSRILRQAVVASALATIAPCLHCQSAGLKGWSAYPKPKMDSPDMICGNRSRMRWVVASSGSQIRITQWSNPVPADLPLHLDETTFSARKSARRHVLEVDDGWLIGFDAGEYGGALWWLSQDGSKRERLVNENVQGIAMLGSRIVVLTGLAHLSMDTGHAFDLTHGHEGRWRAGLRTDLGASPLAFTVQPDMSIMFMTFSGVRRLEPNGKVEQLSDGDFGFLYPGSVAVLPSGEIYVGMNLYVMRLTPSNAGYREEWFIPKECARHEIRGLDCVCLGETTTK